MSNSRLEYDYLRKRLKKQKRKTRRLFFIGLILGGIAFFNLYYWYPLIQTKVNIPTIYQFSLPKKEKAKKKVVTERKKEPEKKRPDFQPRINFNQAFNSPPVFDALSNQIKQDVAQAGVSGTMLVVKNNQVLLYDSVGQSKDVHTDPITSTYMIASVQKAITASLIMSLVQDNKLDLNDSLSKFYPEIPNSEEITLDSMLAMTSGLHLPDKLKNTTSKEEAKKHALDTVTYEPADRWKYSDVNYFLLAMIIEKTSDMSYEDYFNQTIKEPLNLQHTGFYNDPASTGTLIPSRKYENNTTNDKPIDIPEHAYINELGTGNLAMSSGDLLTFVQALIDGNIVSYSNLQKLWEKPPASYNYYYKSGFYDKDGRYSGHGIFRGYESMIKFNIDASNAVVFLSNVYRDNKVNEQLVSTIYDTINQYSTMTNY